MTTLIGLFADEQKAEAAINALAAMDAADVEFQTITQWDNAPEREIAVAPLMNAGQGAGGVAVGFLSSWHLDDEEVDYFRRNVKNGGMLVVVDVNNTDYLPHVRRILEETGEKVVTSAK